MIWNLTEILAIAVECMIVTRMLIQYFKLKKKSNQLFKWLLLFLSLFTADLIGTFCVSKEAFLILSCLIIEIVFAFFFLKGSLFEKVLVSMINYILAYCINLPVLTLIAMITETPAEELYHAQSGERIVCLFITKLLYFAATQLILSVGKKDAYYFRRNEWIIVLSTFFLTLFIGFFIYMLTIESQITSYIYLAIVLLLSMLDLIVFVFMRRMNRIRQAERTRDMIDIQLKQQQEEIQHLEQQMTQMSILRHDFRNGIDCLCDMIAQGDCTGALEYAKQFRERKVNAIAPQVQCSSSMLNAVVNTKFNDAHTKGIDTSLRLVVEVPHSLEFDFSIILSNLLDNAIEACQKNNGASQIILTISEEAGYYRIVIRNTIEQSVIQKNHALKTEKEDKRMHGWGLRSVSDIVDKRDGMIDFYEKNKMFYVDILIPKEENLHLEKS